jgi:hypothetical protein
LVVVIILVLVLVALSLIRLSVVVIVRHREVILFLNGFSDFMMRKLSKDSI